MADGIELTNAETDMLLLADIERAENVRRLRQEASQILKWFDGNAEVVLDSLDLSPSARATQEARVQTAKDITILVATKRAELYRASVPSGVEVRRDRLAADLANAEDMVQLELERLAELDGSEPSATLAARQAALATAQGSLTAAQAALDAFTAGLPE